MPSLTNKNMLRGLRPAAIVAIVGSAILATPMFAAHAQETQTSAPDNAAAKAETVDQRITQLHTELKITPNEEADWGKVAQVMRDNAAAMEKLTADEQQASAPKTAPDDLKTYAKFAQAHVDGLKNLIASFDTLYDSMPDAQKKTADTVFQNFGHHTEAARNASTSHS